MLLTATSTQQGDPYEDLAELYGRMLGQWTLEMNHVTAIVGGFDSEQTSHRTTLSANVGIYANR